jgi:hypothetical protein
MFLSVAARHVRRTNGGAFFLMIISSKRIQEMLEPMQKAGEDFQKMGKENYDAMVRSYGELNKNFQAIASRWADFSKRSFEDASRAWEEMIGAKSVDKAIEVQTKYAKGAYENWIAEMSKIGEMYSSAARDAYKPVQKAMEKHSS